MGLRCRFSTFSSPPIHVRESVPSTIVFKAHRLEHIVAVHRDLIKNLIQQNGQQLSQQHQGHMSRDAAPDLLRNTVGAVSPTPTLPPSLEPQRYSRATMTSRASPLPPQQDGEQDRNGSTKHEQGPSRKKRHCMAAQAAGAWCATHAVGATKKDRHTRYFTGCCVWSLWCEALIKLLEGNKKLVMSASPPQTACAANLITKPQNAFCSNDFQSHHHPCGTRRCVRMAGALPIGGR